MKHAITDRLGHILRVSDTALPESVPITDDQAATLAAGRLARPPVVHMMHQGVMLPCGEALAARRAAILAARPKPPRRVTKLALMRRLEARGKWGVFKSLLASLPEPVRDAWELAQEINESDPLFAANLEAIATGLGLTPEQVGELFA
jgi:hypothetical protein